MNRRKSLLKSLLGVSKGVFMNYNRWYNPRTSKKTDLLLGVKEKMNYECSVEFTVKKSLWKGSGNRILPRVIDESIVEYGTENVEDTKY